MRRSKHKTNILHALQINLITMTIGMRAKRRQIIVRKIRPWFYQLSALVICLLIIISGSLSAAQTSKSPSQVSNNATVNALELEGRTLIVGVSPVPPFVIKSSNTQGNTDWDGIGVQLWREIAYELNLDYQWREVPSIRDNLRL